MNDFALNEIKNQHDFKEKGLLLVFHYIQLRIFKNIIISTFKVLNNNDQAAIVFFTLPNLSEAEEIENSFLGISMQKLTGLNKMMFGKAYANQLKDTFKKYGGKGG